MTSPVWPVPVGDLSMKESVATVHRLTVGIVADEPAKYSGDLG